MMKLPVLVTLIYIGGLEKIFAWDRFDYDYSNNEEPEGLEEVFAWREVDFAWPNISFKNKLMNSGEYISGNNLPLGVNRWKDKLFVTLPRLKSGVAASLNYIPLNSTDKSPKLIPYPDWKANILPENEETAEDNQIISTFRVRVDPCDRLWVLDTGMANMFDNPKQITRPSIVIFDLNTNEVILRYNFGESDINEDCIFANIVVDVTKDKCDRAFAYIPDFSGYGLVVYSYEDNKSWRINHNYFHFDPLRGDLTVGGVNFQWADGIFSVALGPANEYGFRTAYFHPLISTNEFSVSTQVLQNETLATDPVLSYKLFKLEGNRGENTQATASVFDEERNVLFLAHIQKDSVACWNPRRKLVPFSVGTAVHDQEKLVFINDMTIDSERNLWILSDKLPVFVYKGLNSQEISYRILKIHIDEALKGTPC